MPVLVKPDTFRRKVPGDARPVGRSVAQKLTGILTDTRFFRLRKPALVREHEENGLWFHECKAFRIQAFGETRRESWRAFIELFECDWDSIAQEKDSKLTLDAQQLKRKLLDGVESVESLL